MTLTVDQLTSFDSSAFTTAAKNLGAASDGVSSANGQVTSASSNMEFWEGTAADAALNKLGNASSAIVDTPPVLNGASEVLSAFVASVLSHQADLKTAVAQVNALDFPNGAKATIASDGTVTAPPNPVTSCSSDPTTEKANEKTETSYENVAAKTPALQSTIQAALQGAPSDILTYLIAAHHWDPTQQQTMSQAIQEGGNVQTDVGGGSDNGSALGAALVAATGQNVQGHDALAAQAFTTYGHALMSDPSRGDGLSNLRCPLAKVLAQNYSTVTNTLARGTPAGSQGPTDNLQALAYTFSQVSRDPAAYQGLMASAMLSERSQFTAWQADPTSAQLQDNWQYSVQTLGFLQQAHGIALVNEGATQDAGATARAAEINGYIGSGIDAFPLPDAVGPGGDILKAGIEKIWDRVQPMPEPNQHGDEARNVAGQDWDNLKTFVDNQSDPLPNALTSSSAALTAGSQAATTNLRSLYQGQQPPDNG